MWRCSIFTAFLQSEGQQFQGNTPFTWRQQPAASSNVDLAVMCLQHDFDDKTGDLPGFHNRFHLVPFVLHCVTDKGRSVDEPVLGNKNSIFIMETGTIPLIQLLYASLDLMNTEWSFIQLQMANVFHLFQFGFNKWSK